jgi:hypothetical protein
LRTGDFHTNRLWPKTRFLLRVSAISQKLPKLQAACQQLVGILQRTIEPMEKLTADLWQKQHKLGIVHCQYWNILPKSPDATSTNQNSGK